MNKKVFSIFASLSAVAVGALSIYANEASRFVGVLATGEECVHDGYHYAATDATATTNGNVEFWTCCKCHEHFTSNPGSGHFENRAVPSDVPSDVVIPRTEKIAVNSVVLTFNGVQYSSNDWTSKQFKKGAPAPSWSLATDPEEASQYVDIWITKNEVDVGGWPTEVGDYVFCVGILDGNQFVKWGSGFTTHFYIRFSIVEATKEEPTITFSLASSGLTVLDSDPLPTATVSAGADYTVTFSSDALHVSGLSKPTTTGVAWSIVVTVQENDLYTAKTEWRWFYYNHDEEAEKKYILSISAFDKATRQWGNDGNNGVDAANVSENDGVIDFSIDAAGRKGGAIVSKADYNSGSVSMDAKFSKTTGICYSIWTFYYADGGNINHELDIEVYNNNQVVYSSYTSESKVKQESENIDSLINDGEYHNYRISWVAGEWVEYYIDGALRAKITTNVPDHAMKLWIGAWCPTWAGETMSGTYHMLVKNIKYIPAE